MRARSRDSSATRRPCSWTAVVERARGHAERVVAVVGPGRLEVAERVAPADLGHGVGARVMAGGKGRRSDERDDQSQGGAQPDGDMRLRAALDDVAVERNPTRRPAPPAKRRPT